MKKLSKLKIFLCVGLIGLAVLAAGGARGQHGVVPATGDKLLNPLTTSTFTGLFAGIIEWVLGIVSLLTVGMIVYGGIQYIISGGEEKGKIAAKETIKNAIIGLIIVVLSYAFLTAIKGILGI